MQHRGILVRWNSDNTNMLTVSTRPLSGYVSLVPCWHWRMFFFSVKWCIWWYLHLWLFTKPGANTNFVILMFDENFTICGSCIFDDMGFLKFSGVVCYRWPILCQVFRYEIGRPVMFIVYEHILRLNNSLSCFPRCKSDDYFSVDFLVWPSHTVTSVNISDV